MIDFNQTQINEYATYYYKELMKIEFADHGRALLNQTTTTVEFLWKIATPHWSVVSTLGSGLGLARGLEAIVSAEKGRSVWKNLGASGTLLAIAHLQNPGRFSSNFQLLPWVALVILTHSFHHVTGILSGRIVDLNKKTS